MLGSSQSDLGGGVAAAEVLMHSRVRVKVGRDNAGTAWKRGRCPDESREAGRKTHSQHSSLMTV